MNNINFSNPYNEMNKENYTNMQHMQNQRPEGGVWGAQPFSTLSVGELDNRPIKSGSSFKAGNEMNNTEAAFTIQGFEELPPFAEGVDPNQIIETLYTNFDQGKDWKKLFEAVTILRVFNKQYPDEVCLLFDKFWPHMDHCLLNKRTGIVRNILCFVFEVFKMGINKNLDEKIIEHVFPVVLKNCFELATSKKFIKQMCLEICQLVLDNYICNTTVICLCEGAMSIFRDPKNQSKMKKLSQSSMEMITIVLTKLDSSVSECSEKAIQCLFITFSYIMLGCDMSSRSKAKNCCRFMAFHMGKPNYARFVEILSEQGAINEQQAKVLMMDAFEDKGKITRVSEVIQQQKKEGTIQLGLDFGIDLVANEPPKPIYFQHKVQKMEMMAGNLQRWKQEVEMLKDRQKSDKMMFHRNANPRFSDCNSGNNNTFNFR